MFVYIGSYPKFVGAYQIADSLSNLCIQERHRDVFAKWLSNTWVQDACEWIYSKRKRISIVKLHDYDCWNADDTLSSIILPILIALKENKYGAPFVDDSDVPEDIKRTSAPKPENEWDTDANHFKRWDYVIDEMIWTFTELPTDYENKFWSGVFDFETVKGEDGLTELRTTINNTAKFDKKAADEHKERLNNGLRLFSKYYEGLWS